MFHRSRLKVPRLKITSGKFKLLTLTIVCLFTTVATLIYIYDYRTVTYFLRPLWDTPPKSFQIIPHYYADGMNISELCALHGWTSRRTPRRVFDAVIFSNEIDLLEIRMRELMPYVSKFLVVESNTTFTGKPKPLFFTDQKNSRFEFIHPQLLHSVIPSPPLIPNSDPFDNEKYHRIAMGKFLRTAGIEDGDLLITADADEIPSAHTIQLLQNCDGYPSPIHLQLRNYLYSFEFPVDSNSWRSSAELYSKETQYSHARKSDYCLVDAGWHCSFCFRYIQDFAFKMQAYSHADRIRHPSLLNPDRIQNTICKGSDIFDMLPEEYTYKELISKLGTVARSFSGVHLLKYLLENAKTYRYLLPGNCIRDSPPVSS